VTGLWLNFVCRDEAERVGRMLGSVRGRGVTGVCGVDTGSVDRTVEVVRAWGAENGVPCDMSVRVFALKGGGELDSAGGRVKLWRGPEWDWVWWKGGVAEMGAAVRERVKP
jgi:hypothetical protein